MKTCAECGGPVKKPRKRFCCETCRTIWQENRFERARKSPPEMKPIADVDVYFSGETIACPVVGCGWEGQALGQHVNWKHGIDADHLRELLGLNRGQSTITPQLSSILAAASRKNIHSLLKNQYDVKLLNRRGRTLRPQAIKHAKEAKASPEARRILSIAGKNINSARRAALREQLIEQTNRKTTGVCIHCGNTYVVSIMHARRSKYCGQKCRSDHNRQRCKIAASKLMPSGD